MKKATKMCSFRTMFLLLVYHILFYHVTLIIAQPKYRITCDNGKGNYTANSTYQTNLNNLLSSLASNTEIDYGFYNLSLGESPNRVNTIAMCRGDVGPSDCRSCINDSSVRILQVCPNQMEAIGYIENCTLRYSNRSSIFGSVEKSPGYYYWNNINASDPNKYEQDLQGLMVKLRGIAAAGSSLKKFAAGNVSSGYETIFGLVQCTPDLSQRQCEDCLISATSEIPIHMKGKIGGRVRKPSCNLRFEKFRFFEGNYDQIPSPPPTSTTTSNPPSSPEGEKNSTRTVIIIVVPILGVVFFMVSICIFLTVRKRKQKAFERKERDEILTVESLQFDFGTIRDATDNFSEANKLGQGGFGAVYKGALLNGQEIAVKRLSKNSGQGDLEFKNEVLLVAKLQHRNLVRLFGFCLEGLERLLIYEFVTNASLDHFLFDHMKRSLLDWQRRYKIITGIARGLVYLHEDSRLRIVHRDLKASNILLDEEMNPKISDFGMARLFEMDETQANTNRIVGTYGYMAPEYAMHGLFSVKSDVFSFGVMILEIVSGKKNNYFTQNGENMDNLISYVWRSWREGIVSNVIDQTLINGSINEIMRCIHIGLLCVQENAADRPNMASIVLMLNSNSVTLALPSEPAFFMSNRSNNYPNWSSSTSHISGSTRSSQSKVEGALPSSINEVSITELYPR